MTASILYWVLAVVLAPLLLGVINRTKAFFGGRKGQPLLQAYYDLFKLMRKGAVYSRTATWIFRAGPLIGLAVLLAVMATVPAGGLRATFAFQGDFVFLAYSLGLMRFFTVLAALDTGSAFEGMGAAREMQFALLAEPVLFSGLAVLAAGTGQFNLSGIYGRLWSEGTLPASASVLLVAMALLMVLLAENARIPVDDPTTHLELTMIHELMVLDHGGVDLAFIQYGAALKLWLFAALLAGLAIPLRTGRPMLDLAVHIGGVFIAAVIVGIIESTMARLRLLRVPQMLVVALALTLAAFFWILR
ncbi:MAG: NADH-quinone oxidoreductase subunit H [Deltaproteobacteria bacterium]|nr:NADH-quinone oxidoreductase subunit H [Deltaproteobacteria bacterium]